MKALWRALASCAALGLAGCNVTGHVSKEREPRFVAPAPAAAAPRVALVLGSGGPRGFAHIGVLKALEDAGIRPDLVIGSSVGSMVGALYAAGMSARDLERLAYEINVLEFFEFRSLTGGLASGGTIQNYVNTKVDGRPIEQLKIPFVAAATRLSDGKLALFNHGDTGLAVRASGASPGQFEPVRIGDELYIDGDEASPVPIHAARALGARVVIAVDVSAFPEDTPTSAPGDWIAKDARRARQVASESSEADVVVHPNIGYYAGHTEPYRRRVIAIAERVTRERLPAIHAAIARAGSAAAHNAQSAPGPQNASIGSIPAADASR
ncbi:MAG: patatin-like phospholipase family protein [Usitatibacter sp.]